MGKSIKVYGHVNSDGVLSIHHRNNFVSRLKSDFKNTTVEFDLIPRFREFSDDHRGYYFGVVVKQTQKAMRYAGNFMSLKEVDYFLRERFLYYEVFNDESGEYEKTVHTLRKSETQVSSKMMKEYCEMCIIFLAQWLNWPIPYPNEILTKRSDKKAEDTEVFG